MDTKVYLDNLMRLPHRGSATIEEKKAAEYLKQEYENIGLPTELQTFKTIFKGGVIEFLVPAVVLTISYLLLMSGYQSYAIAVGFIGCILYFKIPANFILLLKGFSNSYSQNVVAKLTKPSAKKTLVIVGHYDTAMETVYMKSIGKAYNALFKTKKQENKTSRLDSDKLPFFLKTPVILPNLGIVLLFVTLLTGYRNIGLDIFILFVCAYCISFPLIVWRAPFVPGAFDNGVAAAMVVSLAKYFVNNRPENINVIFLNTGCEENSVKGINDFLKKNSIEKETTYFLNLESIGADKPVICYAESELWTGWPMKYDKEAYKLASDLIKEDSRFARFEETYIPAPSDMIVVVEEGYKVITQIASLSKKGFPEHYHQMSDVEENIDWDSVNLCFEFAKELVIKFDRNF